MARESRATSMPPYLPPRRPASFPDPVKKRSSCYTQTLPPFLPPRTPCFNSSKGPPPINQVADQHQRWYSIDRANFHFTNPTISTEMHGDDSALQKLTSKSAQSFQASGVDQALDHQRRASAPLLSPRLQTLRNSDRVFSNPVTPSKQRAPVRRQSSLRIESRLSEEQAIRPPLLSQIGPSSSGPQLGAAAQRPHSHPLINSHGKAYSADHVLLSQAGRKSIESGDPCKLHRMSPGSDGLIAPLRLVKTPRPRKSLTRLSSLDNIIIYREEVDEWKRASSVLQRRMSQIMADVIETEGSTSTQHEREFNTGVIQSETDCDASSSGVCTPKASTPGNRFRHLAVEIGFVFTIAMTMFLSEFLISGFAVELTRFFYGRETTGTGTFWPASLLSLILSATLLVFARLSDLYGGYPSFMFGTIWLTIWSLIPGFAISRLIVIDVSRAMQGLAIAALTPSTFAMIGSIYSEGPRKNLVLGLYSGCAPLGFFAGFLAAATMPKEKPQWYFWIVAILSGATAITAFLTVPHDKTDRRKLGLKMDWTGAFLITAGLILVSYALAVEPYLAGTESKTSGFANPRVLAPLMVGLGCLAVALRVEGWLAKCPLLPFDFFAPKSVTAFSFAGLCFYASFGVWLYNSTEFFQSPTNTTRPDNVHGLLLAVWYLPTAVGGLILCVAGGAAVHVVPIKVLLVASGLAWVSSPLLLAVSPLPLNYWAAVMPSMLCATLGIDLTFTISIIFLSSIQPLRYQGLAGAVSSILVNLAMSFSLSISELVSKGAMSGAKPPPAAHSQAQQTAEANRLVNRGFQAAFMYGAASAGLGLIICIFFVHIPRKVVRERLEEAAGRDLSSVIRKTAIDIEKGQVELASESPAEANF